MKQCGEIRIPLSVAEQLKDEECCADEIGRSDSTVLMFSDRVLKIEKTSALSDGEHEMLLWMDGRLPAPRALAFERENGFNYLLMTRQDGKMACDCDFSEEDVSRMLAEGLQMLWRADISSCPKRRTIRAQLEESKKRMENGELNGVQPKNKAFSDFETLLSHLFEIAPQDDFVFSHGDYCLPNVFLSEKGVCGFVDLGRAGVSDRYEDIYMCLWSMRYNFVTLGGMSESRFSECERIFFETLGVEKDMAKLRFYELLDEFWI